MSRYIDADAFIDDLYEHEFSNWCDKDEVSTLVNDAPSIDLADYVPKDFHDKTCEAMAKAHQEEIADMVSVVRCKECKHNYNKVLNHGKMYPRCDFTDWKLSENDYCSRGEREGE